MIKNFLYVYALDISCLFSFLSVPMEHTLRDILCLIQYNSIDRTVRYLLLQLPPFNFSTSWYHLVRPQKIRQYVTMKENRKKCCLAKRGSHNIQR